jgi:DNA-binding CsgD family transcriptional regulator
MEVSALRAREHTGGVTLADTPSSEGFVGRADELDELASALASARAGRGRAVLVIGEAGVGKTRLAQQACALAGDFLVLTGACLPLSSMTVPLLPLRSAVGVLPEEQRPAMRRAADAESAEDFDQWLEDRCARGPVALVVDDLQWSDPATLDVLMWVMAGLTTRSLALVVTVRREEVSPGHPLQRWLADVRRLPGFVELPLGPLDLEETRAQLTSVLGDVPHDALTRDVYSRTGGNSYLNRLLVQGLSPTETALGPGLPEDLAAAVLRAWHQLDSPARDLAQVLAVYGRVAGGSALDRVAGLAHVTDLRSALRHCLAANLLEADGRGGYWFHHPLQAQALAGGLGGLDRAHLHAAFAAALEDDLATAAARDTGESAEWTLEAVSLVADHHDRAGHAHQAYDAGLRAADLAREIGATSTQVRLLARALELRRQLGPGEAGPTTALWERLRLAAEAVGDFEEELRAVEALLAGLDERRDPLRLAELVVRRQHLRFLTGRGFLDPAELRRAVRLTRGDAESWQHAFALAELTHATLWQDDPASHDLGAAALASARASANPRALAHALAANAMLAVHEGRSAEGVRLGREAVEAAATARDGFAFVHAALWEANSVDGPISPEWRTMVGRRWAELAELGAPHPLLAWLASNEAFGHLHAGDLEACARRLRVALGSTPGTLADVQTRLTAAWMAAIQGRIHEAEGHLARADELFAETSNFLAFDFDAVRAMVLLSGGHPREALDAAMKGTTTPGTPPTLCEWLLPLAARALADLAQQERDTGGDPTRWLAELDVITARFPDTIRDVGGATDLYEHQLTGLGAMYHAEASRARRAGDAHLLWARAATALHEILPWEASYSSWRQAEALLASGHAGRDEAVGAMRRSYAVARRLGAQPLVDELDALARATHVQLAEPATGVPAPATARKAGLTTRETEILGHIVAGRTYGEIAKALVVSEKTVSSHVSHLLSKTGCANRVDLARWATRT